MDLLGPGPVPLPVHGLALFCLTGPDAGRPYPLVHAVTLIGRGKHAHVRVRDRAVSRVHAFLRCGGGRLSIRRAPGPNGLYVNGEPTETERPLSHGDVIALGRTELRVHLPALEKPPALPAEPEPKPSFDDGRRSTASIATLRPPPRPRATPARWPSEENVWLAMGAGLTLFGVSAAMFLLS